VLSPLPTLHMSLCPRTRRIQPPATVATVEIAPQMLFGSCWASLPPAVRDPDL